jgi:hypothetical protein
MAWQPGRADLSAPALWRCWTRGALIGVTSQPYQTLKLHITEGPLNCQEIDVEQGLPGSTNQSRVFRAGDRVLVQHTCPWTLLRRV